VSDEPAGLRARLGRLARNKTLLIMLGGGLGSHLRYWLPIISAQVSLVPMGGGAVGSYARYRLGKWFNSQPWGQVFPYGTLVINVTGSFVLGLAAVAILEGMDASYRGWYLLIGTGFCGGFTTFSTFEWETFKLVRDGSWRLALANVAGSFAAGFAAVVLAAALAGGDFSPPLEAPAFPWSTFAINVSGSFILGFAAMIILEKLPPEHQDWYLLIGTGFCGGFTTFSTFEWETFNLVRDGSYWQALSYVLGSIVAGFLGVRLGVTLAGLIPPTYLGELP
jgi:CrcB protein